MHHGGEGSDGQNVTRDFDGAFLGLAINFLHALGVRHRAHVPDIGKNFTRCRFEQLRQLAVVIPGAGDRAFVNFALSCAEFRILRGGDWWNVGLRAVEPDVTLALLLGIIERVRVKE